MKICHDHWGICRDAVRDAGLDGLGSRDGEEAIERFTAELQEVSPEKNFDPLMSMNSHWWSVALKCGGLAMMGETPDGSNDGHFCPLCELDSHYKEFDVLVEVRSVADQMAKYARAEKLIPQLS